MTSHKSKGIQTLVDAGPAMLHVRSLIGRGMSAQSIADRAGVNDRTVRAYFTGWSWTSTRSQGNVKRPVSRGTTDTVDRILAVKFEEEWDPSLFQPAKLRGLRESKGLSRKTLAEAAGICAETIQYWETGRSLPKYRPKLDAVLALLGAEWGDVSGVPESVTPDEDAYSVMYRDGAPDAEADFVPDYPCHVCGGTFRSRLTLATHPHPAKVKVSA